MIGDGLYREAGDPARADTGQSGINLTHRYS